MLSDVTRAGTRERQQMLDELCEIAQGSWVEPEDYLRETLDTWGEKTNKNKNKNEEI